MQPTIRFSDYEMKEIMRDTGLSRLELMGVIAAMNRHTYSREQIERSRLAELRGDDY